MLELRGVVGGKAETQAGVTMMLNMADHNAPILDVPRSEQDALNSSLISIVRLSRSFRVKSSSGMFCAWISL